MQPRLSFYRFNPLPRRLVIPPVRFGKSGRTCTDTVRQFKFSRTFDDPRPPTCLIVPIFQGILASLGWDSEIPYAASCLERLFVDCRINSSSSSSMQSTWPGIPRVPIAILCGDPSPIASRECTATSPHRPDEDSYPPFEHRLRIVLRRVNAVPFEPEVGHGGSYSRLRRCPAVHIGVGNSPYRSWHPSECLVK